MNAAADGKLDTETLTKHIVLWLTYGSGKIAGALQSMTGGRATMAEVETVLATLKAASVLDCTRGGTWYIAGQSPYRAPATIAQLLRGAA